jgi:hypothetical protein
LACIYGLKQASFYWNNELSTALISFGWVQCEVDKCLFVKYNTDTPPKIVGYVVFHVDDILAASSRPILEELQKSLSAIFPMKMLVFPSTFTGITVQRFTGGALKLHQAPYVKRMVDLMGFGGASASNTPTTMSRVLDEPATEEEKIVMADVPFRKLQGVCLWLTLTSRLELCFAAHQTGRRSADPRPVDWTGMKKIFRYLKGTPEFFVEYIENSMLV